MIASSRRTLKSSHLFKLTTVSLLLQFSKTIRFYWAIYYLAVDLAAPKFYIGCKLRLFFVIMAPAGTLNYFNKAS